MYMRSRGFGALPCCPTQNPASCPTGGYAFCIGGDSTQPCDPTCTASETITFGTAPPSDMGTTAAGLLAQLGISPPTSAPAPPSGGAPSGAPKPSTFNWALIGVAALGAVLIVRSAR